MGVYVWHRHEHAREKIHARTVLKMEL